MAKERIKEEARAGPMNPSMAIIPAQTSQLVDEARNLMPSYSGLQRTVERQREIPGRRYVDARNLNDILIEVN